MVLSSLSRIRSGVNFRRILRLTPFIVVGAGLVCWELAFCDLSLGPYYGGICAVAGGLLIVIGAVAYAPEC